MGARCPGGCGLRRRGGRRLVALVFSGDRYDEDDAKEWALRRGVEGFAVDRVPRGWRLTPTAATSWAAVAPLRPPSPELREGPRGPKRLLERELDSGVVGQFWSGA
jgi:hypothetical protein